VKKIAKLMLTTLLLVFLLVFVAISSATTISYEATDLTDTTTGEDLWQYSYTVGDNTFAADTGFTIYFDLGLYDLLDPSPAAPNGDWDVITWNPDSSLMDDGAYDAYALSNNASLADMFTVSFVLTGGSSAPGPQFFEVYDGFTWSILEEGNTASAAAPVPEPATILLVGSGLIGLAGLRKKAWKSRK